MFSLLWALYEPWDKVSVIWKADGRMCFKLVTGGFIYSVLQGNNKLIFINLLIVSELVKFVGAILQATYWSLELKPKQYFTIGD